jgi:hypothetical protein
VVPKSNRRCCWEAREPERLQLIAVLRAYRSFEKTLSVTMRQTHAAGERLFVDHAGDGVLACCRSSGANRNTSDASVAHCRRRTGESGGICVPQRL